MKEKQSLLQRLSRELELEDEALPGKSLVEIAEDRRVLIENHLGVNAYSRERIGVNTKFGSVEVFGQNLELARMTADQLVITGCIGCVKLCRRKRG